MNRDTILKVALMGGTVLILSACGNPSAEQSDSEPVDQVGLVEFGDSVTDGAVSNVRQFPGIGKLPGVTCLRQYLRQKMTAYCGDASGTALLKCLREHREEIKQKAQEPIAHAKASSAQLKADCCPPGESVWACVQGIRAGTIPKSAQCQAGIDRVRGAVTEVCDQF